MTNREKLKENYEDALFALLMDEVAQREGERALELNRQLQSDPNAAVPEDIQRHCEETIRIAFTKKQRRKNFGKVLKMLAVAAVVGALMFTAAFAASEKFRASTLNALMTVLDKGTDITFRNNSASPNMAFENGSEIELQDKLVLSDQREYDVALKLSTESTEIDTDWTLVNGPKGHLVLKNLKNSTIDISVMPYDESAIFFFDTEDCDKRSITVGKHTADLYTKTEEGLNKHRTYLPSSFDLWSKQKVFWIDELHQNVILISGTNVTEETILHVANSLSLDG